MIDDKNDMDERSREFLKDRFGTTKNLELLDRLSPFGTNPESWPLWVLRHLPLKPHDAILEVGCGTGRFWAEVSPHLPVGVRICLTDVSPAMVFAARKTMAGEHDPDFLVDDVESLCFKGVCFDAVFANHVLHAVPNISAAFAEISRVLKPGGIMIFSVMSNEHMRELGVALAELHPKFVYPTSGVRRLSLECDKPELSARFHTVRVNTHVDVLEVSDKDLIVDTALSIFNGIKYPDLSPYAGDFKKLVLSRMQKNDGIFHLTTKNGLYTCRRI
ncbi:MAG: class I SAM-dependent methyltransferase [Desulfobacteraceae bacterium]|nr:class I SAM-dependent methyltransferase [Desulfobacteraceae bacterium]